MDLADSEREAALERITERNIVLLLEDIIERCQGIFMPASRAVVRRIESKRTALIDELSTVPVPAEQHPIPTWLSKERLVVKVRAFDYVRYSMRRVCCGCMNRREGVLDLI